MQRPGRLPRRAHHRIGRQVRRHRATAFRRDANESHSQRRVPGARFGPRRLTRGGRSWSARRGGWTGPRRTTEQVPGPITHRLRSTAPLFLGISENEKKDGAPHNELEKRNFSSFFFWWRNGGEGAACTIRSPAAPRPSGPELRYLLLHSTPLHSTGASPRSMERLCDCDSFAEALHERGCALISPFATVGTHRSTSRSTPLHYWSDPKWSDKYAEAILVNTNLRKDHP